MDAKRHLLIVDDDPDLRDTLHEYFETAGFTVSSVADGPGMRRVLKDGPADIIIMDLHLPGEDGLELACEADFVVELLSEAPGEGLTLTRLHADRPGVPSIDHAAARSGRPAVSPSTRRRISARRGRVGW